jgi:protoporphyrinogen oxidase
MNGQQSYKPTFSDFIKRRSFLLRIGLITGSIFLNGCYQKIKPKKYQISGALKGPNATAGHALRDKLPMPQPSATRQVKVLIIGSGISGLSAGRWLQKSGTADFEILELESHTGGNSHFQKNDISAYPLGAHYITVANTDDELLLDFLQEIKVITHFEKGLPYYNDFYLTFDPEERLLINGEWQEGLVPEFGVPEADKKEIKKFLVHVEKLKLTKGNDGKFLFNIPISNSSRDEKYTQLDQISFAQYLKENGYQSKYLLWYLNYACKDDYGKQISKVSAWAGLHYFASRRGKASNAEDNAIVTWPEGNGWLMKTMAEQLKGKITTSTMCFELKEMDNGQVETLNYQISSKKTIKIIADKVILCSPQYVNNRLLKNIIRPSINYSAFTYSPWVVANITVNQFPSAKGLPLCWDNVAFNTPSVGYVNAGQQQLDNAAQKIITYYLPLCDYEPSIARLAAYARTYDQWLDIIIPELNYIHPEIEKAITNIDVWVWGHGMIAPTPNFIFSKNLELTRKAINDKIFFAHSDLSGISIFEEAFHQGINAAKQALNQNG